MEDEFNGRRRQWMEDDFNGRRHQKTTQMEDNLNERWLQWKTASIEDDDVNVEEYLNGCLTGSR